MSFEGHIVSDEGRSEEVQRNNALEAERGLPETIGENQDSEPFPETISEDEIPERFPEIIGEEDGSKESENLIDNHKNPAFSEEVEDSAIKKIISLFTETYEPNSSFKDGENIYYTDDNGKVFKINDIKLLPNSEYIINGALCRTDELARIKSVDADPKLTPEGIRDYEAQIVVGGVDRRKGDHGGHLLARILGGSPGIENMVAIRGVINQGPYRSMEIEIVSALNEGKDVHMHCDIKYEGESQRPSELTITYNIGGKENVLELDNNIGSTKLLSSLSNVLNSNDYEGIKQRVENASNKGANVSIISVKTEKGDDGNIQSIKTIIRDENTGTNYRGKYTVGGK